MLKLFQKRSLEKDNLLYLIGKKLSNIGVDYYFTILIIGVVCLPLFILFQTNNSFYFVFSAGLSEWNNHSWLIGYFGEYFFRHLSFPTVINTHQFFNIPFPAFYAGLFYRLTGLVSAMVGAQIAIKLCVVLVCLIQFMSVLNLTRKITHDKWLSFAVATLCAWSIYALTNLYNRSDLTEFFAVSLLTTAFCMWLYAFEVHDVFSKIKLRFVFALAISVSFCFHPITALYGSLFMSVIIMVTLPRLIEEKPLSLTIFVCICLFCYVFLALSPWIYMVWKFIGNLPLLPSADVNSLWYIPGIDSLLVRLSPFPLDMRAITGGINVDFGTPYLDAQTNVPLLILSLGIILYIFRAYLHSQMDLIDKKYAFLLLATVVLFLFFFLASLYKEVFSLLPRMFLIAQFAYRLVAYQDLALLGMTITGLAILSKNEWYVKTKSFLYVLVLVSLVVSLQGLLLKEIHAWSVMKKEDRSEFSLSRANRNNLLNIPPHFYAFPYYEITTTMNKKSIPVVSNILSFRVGEGRHFGQNTKHVRFVTSKPSYIALLLYPFPWNHIYVDNQLIDSASLFWDGSKIILPIHAGDHNVSVKFEPLTTWWICQNISSALIMLGIIWVIFSFWMPSWVLNWLRFKRNSKLSHENST